MENAKSKKYIVPAGTVVITGPQGCGKSKHGTAIARHYGKTAVVDEWIIGMPIPANAIALTSETRLVNAIPFKNAMRAAGLASRGAQ